MKSILFSIIMLMMIQFSSFAQQRIKVYSKPDSKSEVLDPAVLISEIKILDSSTNYYHKVSFKNSEGYVSKSQWTQLSNKNSTNKTNYKPSSSKKYTRGPRGGCYYISSSGKKVYVDRSLCN